MKSKYSKKTTLVSKASSNGLQKKRTNFMSNLVKVNLRNKPKASRI